MARNDHAGLYILLTFASIFGFTALAFATARLGPAAIPIWGMALGAAALIFRGPVGRALGEMLAGRRGDEIPPELPAEILAELDDLRTRVAELEERADFSERLLSQQGARAEGRPGA